jgi:hypothetical protein
MMMVTARVIGRIGILAAGLGIGMAIASTPGIASADPVTFDPNDIAISFDGYSLFQEGSASADSGGAGDFNFAFADGAGATANAFDGTGDLAEAEGTNAFAEAGDGNGDTAIDIGNNTPSSDDGAFAGLDSPAFGGPGNNDLAFVLGDNSVAGSGGTNAYFFGDPPEAGNNDIAAVFDPFGTVGSTAYSGASFGGPGDFDLGAVFGDGFNGNTEADATGANYLVEILPTVAGLDSTLSTLLTDLASLF